MLSDRRQKVLAALIEEYVAHAMPVGSRTLTERYQLGVSPATVRNELSVLEEGGYIAQPHTSAGRIPTDYGYRTFVDRLLESSELEEESEYAPVADELRRSAREVDDLIAQTSAALNRLTDCLSIVMAPSVVNMQLKQISVISMNLRHALIVLVTEDGQVLNRHMNFEVDVYPEDLAHVQNALTDVLCGRDLADIESNLDHAMSEILRSPLVRLVLEEIMDCLQESGITRSHRVGLSALMAKPEFSSTSSLLPVMQVLEDDIVLLNILDDAASAASGPVVRIGHENAAAQLSGVSVVANKFGKGSEAGVVAVIGPTRMDYSKVINAVKAASSVLNEI